MATRIPESLPRILNNTSPASFGFINCSANTLSSAFREAAPSIEVADLPRARQSEPSLLRVAFAALFFQRPTGPRVARDCCIALHRFLVSLGESVPAVAAMPSCVSAALLAMRAPAPSPSVGSRTDVRTAVALAALAGPNGSVRTSLRRRRRNTRNPSDRDTSPLFRG